MNYSQESFYNGPTNENVGQEDATGLHTFDSSNYYSTLDDSRPSSAPRSDSVLVKNMIAFWDYNCFMAKGDNPVRQKYIELYMASHS